MRALRRHEQMAAACRIKLPSIVDGDSLACLASGGGCMAAACGAAPRRASLLLEGLRSIELRNECSVRSVACR